MSQQPCTRCPVLEAEIQRLQVEILRLQRIIEQAKGVCVTVASDANKVMAGHVARGKWSYAKGALHVAQAIAKILN